MGDTSLFSERRYADAVRKQMKHDMTLYDHLNPGWKERAAERAAKQQRAVVLRILLAGLGAVAATAVVLTLIFLTACTSQPPGAGLSNDLCQTVVCHPA